MNRVMPNFFIIGAAKSGTTSMYHYLESHPDVYMPSFKEPHWFARVEPNSDLIVHSVTSEAEYLGLFEYWEGERAIGEASPSYLWDLAAPSRIQEEVPDAKIIILLREPVSRAFSHYLMDVREGMEGRPFLKALQEDYLLCQVEKPEADPQAIEFLRRIYAPEMACLGSVLGRELPWEPATG